MYKLTIKLLDGTRFDRMQEPSFMEEHRNSEKDIVWETGNTMILIPRRAIAYISEKKVD